MKGYFRPEFMCVCVVQVVLSAAEEKAGLRLAPDKVQVQVLDKPIDGLRFSQFRATVSGVVTCTGQSHQAPAKYVKNNSPNLNHTCTLKH